MAGETSAQLTAMKQAALQVDRASAELARVRHTIAQAVASTAGGYSSPAADLFRSTMDQWSTDFTRIVGGLDRIREALHQNARQYEATLDQERQSANQIAAVLNGGES